LQIRLGEHLLNGPKIKLEKWREILSLGNIAALVCLFAGSLAGYTVLGTGLGMVVFVLTSGERLRNLYRFILGAR
jgi:hypothetical protein